MWLRNLFLKTVRDLRGQILGWGLGAGAMALMVMLLYPAFREQMGAFVALLDKYPPALVAFFGDITRMTDLRGWVNVEFFTWMPPILTVFAIGAGTGLIAGEEEKGTLDLLLSQPIRRWRVVAEKFLAFAAATLLILLLTALCFLIGAAMIGEGESLDILILATFHIAPIILVSGALSLLASVWLRSRRLAVGIAAALVIGSWFVDSLGKVVNVLEPYRPFTLFHYYDSDKVLTHNTNWGNIGVLLGLTALFFAIALLAFQHRDIAV